MTESKRKFADTELDITIDELREQLALFSE